MALCWLLTLGIVPVVAAWLRSEGSSPWWAALLLVNAGIAATVLRVTLDGAALFFLLLASPPTGASDPGAATRPPSLPRSRGRSSSSVLSRWRDRGTQPALAPRRRSTASSRPAPWRSGGCGWRRPPRPSRTPRGGERVLGWPFGWLPEQIERLRALADAAPAHFRSEVVGLVALARRPRWPSVSCATPGGTRPPLTLVGIRRDRPAPLGRRLQGDLRLRAGPDRAAGARPRA